MVYRIMHLENILASISTIVSGEKTLEKLHRLGCYRVIDLIFHLPVNVITKQVNPNLQKVENGSYITTLVKIDKIDPPPFKYKPTRGKPFKISCHNETGPLTIIFFNYYPAYLVSNLSVGEQRYVSGKVERYLHSLTMAHPDEMFLSHELEKINKVEVIYPLTYGVTSKQLAKIIKKALTLLPELAEWGNKKLIGKYNLPSFKEALIKAHCPESLLDLVPGNINRKRLAYDELLAHQLTLHLGRSKSDQQTGHELKATGLLVAKLLSILPFELTAAQKNAIEIIAADQASPKRMMRLIQGDVGCGKTIVALAAMLRPPEVSKQAALMAPTDLLATQHYNWISSVTKDFGIKVELLTGNIKGKKREALLRELQAGEIDLLIGTHALFQDNVIFKDLGLIVIDEQHRFGVGQRLALSAKGDKVDILAMSATPIPRTLTLAIYGDMDITRISEKPPGRSPITTSLIPSSKIKEVFASVQRLIENNEKLYWICPLIEQQADEKEENNFKKDLAAAVARFHEFNELFPGKVGLVHGKMKAAEKEAMMKEFAEGALQMLVATTVIEVGIDVKDAAVMIIEQAERFGLSQLHQLRGRVGRGTKQSYCILLYSYPISEVGKARLKIMRNSEDGFEIAEEDLRLRGAGDIVGTKQSGLPSFKFADFLAHQDLFPLAQRQAAEMTSAMLVGDELSAANIKTLLKIFGYNEQLEYLYSG
jgi:ATP-dependent DNA helicase RecG